MRGANRWVSSSCGLWLMLLTGCSSVVGTWRLARFDPPEPQPAQALMLVAFDEQGGFVARVRTGTTEGELRGTYKYDGMTEQLSLVGTDGTQFSCAAEPCAPCRMLTLRGHTPAGPWKAEYHEVRE